MQPKFWLRIVTALGCILMFQLSAAEPVKPTVVFGVHNFPPDFVVSSDGQTCGGPGVAFSAQVLAEAGLRLQTYCLTPARMFVLLEKGEIDVSINIKSTAALQSQVQPVFVDPPYLMLQLVLYSHKKTAAAPGDDSVALIRAFDYHGQRKKLAAAGYRFVDMPDAMAAIDLFVHQRTEHLLTYEGPFRAFLSQRDPKLLESLQRQPLDAIAAHYVISGKSAYQTQIKAAFERYAARHQCRLLRDCKAL